MSVSTQPEARASHSLLSQEAGVQRRMKRGRFHPLLNIPIAWRLALGFLIPALLSTLALGSVAARGQQMHDQETTFYQALTQNYSSLNTGTETLDQLHSNLLGLLNDVSKAQTSAETVKDDFAILSLLTSRMNADLQSYQQQDVFMRHPDLVALFDETGQGGLVDQQSSKVKTVVAMWRNYNFIQQSILTLIGNKQIALALAVETGQAEPAYSNGISALQQLINIDERLVYSIQDVTVAEQNSLRVTTAIAALSMLLGIAIVGWLVFATLVQRLQRLRRMVNSIEGGKVEARLDVVGCDEIARVSGSINDMLDTIVGLLEETRQQRDELANAEELKHLHQELQSKHEALNEANARLAALATSDPLTGLPNHRTVMTRLEEEISRCHRTQESCAVLFIDLDHFKQINDTWGHRAGDAVLCETGKRLSKALRLEDFVGRYGGEEFAIILTNVALAEAREVADRLQHVLADESFPWEAEDASQSTSIAITGSIGVALLGAHGNTCETLIEAADAAMYHAKRTGRNRVSVSGEEKTFVQQVLEANIEEHTPDTYVLQALTAVASAHDGDTSAHSMRLVNMARETARALSCSEEEVRLVRLAALLHDIGKVGIPHEILHKPGPLTDDEWSVMRRHPKIGRQILAQAGGKFELLSHIVVAHHEHWDGKGYPYGLSGETIPLGARILAVIDSFDAMTSNRPYRKAMPVSDARNELQRCAGQQYDPRVVAAFLHMLDQQEQRQGQPDESLVSLP